MAELEGEQRQTTNEDPSATRLSHLKSSKASIRLAILACTYAQSIVRGRSSHAKRDFLRTPQLHHATEFLSSQSLTIKWGER
jgi:hypothetical protein